MQSPPPLLLPLLLALVFCLPPVTLPASTQGPSPPNDTVCLTKGCESAASELIKSIDESVDPCTNFYQFACGNYIKDTVIPNDKSDTGTFTLVEENLNQRLRLIFESECVTSEPAAYQNVRNHYQSCMNTDYIKKNSCKEVREILQELGGWPALCGNEWNSANFQWMESAILAMEKGFDLDGLIDIRIAIDTKNTTKRIIQIDEPTLGLSREYLVKGLEDNDVKAYLKYMVDIAVFLGASERTASDEMMDALSLEIEVAKITLPQGERRNKTALYNPMTVKDISALYPLPWGQYLNRIVPLEDDLVNVAVPNYLRSLNTLLASTPVRTIANLTMWRHAQFSVDFLPEEAEDIKLEFDKVIKGKASKSPRWETCVKKTAGNEKEENYYFFYAEGSLTNAVGAMYAKKHFPASAKKIIKEMVENIRAEFRLILEEVDWMDEQTRAQALEKADLITTHIAYSKEILDDDLIEEHYDGLTLGDTSYFRNILQLKCWIFAYYQKEFKKPIDRQSWKTHGGAAITNAFYKVAENSIILPAGILNGVFFDKDRPLYMNYGGIGTVVGHEITHGFDDQGSQNDGEGNLVDWWKSETKQQYLEKTQCVIGQYSNYTVKAGEEVLNVNGNNTQAENVADSVGVKEAFRSYMRIAKR